MNAFRMGFHDSSMPCHDRTDLGVAGYLGTKSADLPKMCCADSALVKLKEAVAPVL